MLRCVTLAALVALTAAPALAQEAAPTTPPAAANQRPSQLEQVGLTPPTVVSEGHRITAEEVMVRDVLGITIYTSVEEDAQIVGIIRDLVIGPLGDITTAVVDVGDYLGTGEKDVAIAFAEFQRAPGPNGEVRWVFEADPQVLAEAPAFVWPSDMPAADPGPMTESEEAEQLIEGDPNAAPVDPELTTDQPESGGGPETNPINLPQPSAAELQGMGVYGQNDQPIGTIGTVIESPEGGIEAIVIDVGGFLGLGAKPVAVAFENLTFGTDTSGNRYLFLNATRQELEAQPAYDPGTYESSRDEQLLVVAP